MSEAKQLKKSIGKENEEENEKSVGNNDGNKENIDGKNEKNLTEKNKNELKKELNAEEEEEIFTQTTTMINNRIHYVAPMLISRTVIYSMYTLFTSLCCCVTIPCLCLNCLLPSKRFKR